VVFDVVCRGVPLFITEIAQHDLIASSNP